MPVNPQFSKHAATCPAWICELQWVIKHACAPAVCEPRQLGEVDVALAPAVEAGAVARQHARIGRVHVARHQRQLHPRLRLHAKHLDHLRARTGHAWRCMGANRKEQSLLPPSLATIIL
eukprot:3487136-Pleurochrysis_carterae.AAC.1